MADMLKAAQWYANRGLPVIPVSDKKKPLIKWQAYQSKMPSEAEIKTWWGKWPDANIGIVTGKISGITVIDIDSDGGLKAIEAMLPDGWLTPTAKSPRGGRHYYCKYEEGLGNSAGVIKDVDVRSEGGFIICPPSSNGRGAYAWFKDLSIIDLGFNNIPKEVLSILVNTTRARAYIGETTNERQRIPTNMGIKIPKGMRDDTIFHIANRLLKGRATNAELQQYLTLIALYCCEKPFPIKEIPIKISSALERIQRQRRSWKEEVLGVLNKQSGNFKTTDLQRELTEPTNANEKKKISATLSRLVEEGYIERIKIGEYRILEKDLEFDEWYGFDDTPLGVRFPFGMERVVEIFSGGIITFAGETNGGKTALAFEMIKLNKKGFPETCYHSSELGPGKFKHRLSLSAEKDLEFFKDVKFKGGLTLENAAGRTREGWLNIFDYLEPTDGEFYKIPSTMRDIHLKLGEGIAIICLQKNKGVDWGNGGQQTMAKSSLYCNLEEDWPGNKLVVKKCKEFKGATNPKNWEMKYKIVDGINLMPEGIFGPDTLTWRE